LKTAFIRDYATPISEVMTKEKLVTAPVGTTLTALILTLSMTLLKTIIALTMGDPVLIQSS
jgi:hypothetical protein